MHNKKLSLALPKNRNRFSEGEGRRTLFNALCKKGHRVVVILFIWLFFYSSLNILTAQTLEETFAYANEQMNKQEYDNALGAYQRVLFFDKKMGDKIYYNLAECHFKLNHYEQATKYYDLAYYVASNDSLKFDALFHKTNCLLLQHNYRNALIELMSLDDSLPEYWQNKKYFYFGITYFGLEDFDKSQNYFVKANATQTNEIEQLFIQNKKVSKINPKTARVLSIILPGLGQLYCGDIRNGLNSFLLTSGFLGLAIYTMYSYTVVEAFLSVLPWYQRYYLGGFQGAMRIAQEKKDQKRAEIFQQLMDVFAKNK